MMVMVMMKMMMMTMVTSRVRMVIIATADITMMTVYGEGVGDIIADVLRWFDEDLNDRAQLESKVNIKWLMISETAPYLLTLSRSRRLPLVLFSWCQMEMVAVELLVICLDIDIIFGIDGGIIVSTG